MHELRKWICKIFGHDTHGYTYKLTEEHIEMCYRCGQVWPVPMEETPVE